MATEPFDARGRFGPMAPRYEEAFTASTGLRSISDRELAVITRRLGDVRARRILDAGIGTGRVARRLGHLGASVVGLDVTPEMLAHCRTSAPDVPSVLGRVGAPLPFADRSFDDAVCVRVLKYVQDWERAFGEFRRVLRPGARLVVEIANARSVARWGYRGQAITFGAAADTQDLLRGAGFLPMALDAGTRLPFGLYARSKSMATATLDRVERVAGRILGDVALARSFFVTAELVD